MKTKNNLLNLSFFFTLFFIVSVESSFSSDKAEETMRASKNIPQCLYSLELKGEEIEIMENAYAELIKNDVGKKLLDKLQEKLLGKPSLVINRTALGHAFMPPKENTEGGLFCIDINFEKIRADQFVSITGCIGLEVKKLDDFEMFEIGESVAPFCITLAHELIHLKHFLQNEVEYRRFQNEFTNELWPVFGDDPRASKIWCHR